MSISRVALIAVGTTMLLVGAASQAQADRNRYTQLRPGQAYPVYRTYRRYGPPVVPYGYEMRGPGFAYGYGYPSRYGYGGYGYRGYRYGGPGYDGYDGPY